MTDFYISADGNDAASGTAQSPWKSITRLNSALASSSLGDRAFLRRGDTFYGAIRPKTNLNPLSPGWVKIGSYGVDQNKPIVSGYKLLNIESGWQQHDLDTWKVDYGAPNHGITYSGYDSAQGGGDVGILKVDSDIKSNKRAGLAGLVNQWDYYSSGTILYVRSTDNPALITNDIRCTVDHDGIRMGSGVEVADLSIIGFGGCGALFSTDTSTVNRARLLRCDISDIGGSFLNGVGDGTTRYGNGVQIWTSSSNIHCELNNIHDVYDAAYSIQGGNIGQDTHFENITWRRNLTYRCSQAEEYWYQGTGVGFVNCKSEYNTNIFSGYGFGGDSRPDTGVRVGVLTYKWGDDSAQIEPDLVLRRNIYHDSRDAFSYHAFDPTGLASNRNIISLQSGTKMRYQNLQTIDQASQWADISGRELNTRFFVLPIVSSVQRSAADVESALVDIKSKCIGLGQIIGNNVIEICNF